MSWYDDMAVDLPDGQHGAVAIDHFTLTGKTLEELRLQIRGRGARLGTYTRMRRNGALWMSDTTAERYDHAEVAQQIQRRGGRVLIGGLGLGMIVRVALLVPGVTHVDVVEIDPDVLALVGPHYMRLAASQGKTLVLHQADLLTLRWPTGAHWDVAWFDIWQDLDTDNLAEVARLRRSYARRADWCDCWGRLTLLAARRRESSW